MAYVYILYSPSLKRYYIGFTTITLEERLQRHLTGYYKGKFTSKATDWQLFYSAHCSSIRQARQIEAHIKRMKSAVYIQNLANYPEIIEKLKSKYSGAPDP